jgi:hypothetical protein
VEAEAGDPLRRERANSRLEGAAIDTGAQRSVTGLQQARAYAQMVGSRVDILPSRRLFRFGDVTCSTLGSMTVEIPCPTGMPRVAVDDISPDILLLLGLDLMDRLRLRLLSVPNVL